MVRKGLADLSTFVLANQREAANLGYAYPAQFSDHVFEGADGERIAASVGLHEGGGRPGLIIVHGLFSSRRFDYVRQIAVRAYYDWGFNVLALDLRSFGLTNLTSAAPTTVGWKEGEDIIAAGLYLKQLGATTVGCARHLARGRPRSSGACHPEGATEALDGGIVAISPPADPRAMAEAPLGAASPHGSGLRAEPRVLGDAQVPCQAGAVGGDRRLRRSGRACLGSVLRRGAGRALVAGARLKSTSHAARVPVLVLHPEDDDVIPVDHARKLAERPRRTRSSFASGSSPAEATARSMPSIESGSTPSCGVSSSGGQGTRAGTAQAMSARTARGPS